MSTYRYFYAKTGALQPKTGIYHRPAKTVNRAKRSREDYAQASDSPTIDPIADEATPDQLRTEIYAHLLAQKRTSRYFKLMEQFEGSPEDIEAIRAYLPEKYKAFAADPELLEVRLLSESKFQLQTQIWGILAITSCYGCQYDRPGQRDHMDCRGGCLHDPTICLRCS